MILKNKQFNHESSGLVESLNVPEITIKKCKERIVFCSFSNYLQGKELYNSEEEIPRSMTTASGDLQRVLALINDQEEYEFTLFNFTATHNITKMAIAYHRFMNDLSNSKQDRAKAKLMALAADLKLREEVKSVAEADIDMLSPKALIKRIELVQQSHYDFNTYYNMVNLTKFEEYDTDPSLDSDSSEDNPFLDIDGLLNDLFK